MYVILSPPNPTKKHFWAFALFWKLAFAICMCAFLEASLCMDEAIQTIRIPVKFTDLADGSEKFQIQEWPILDPHSVVSFLFEDAKLSIPQQAIHRYWEHHCRFGEPWAQNTATHGMVPLGLFGDSARASTAFGHVNVVGIFMNIILFRPKSIRLSRYLLFAIEDEKLWGHHTLNTVYRRVCWSLRACFQGIHPCYDQYGKELPARLKKVAGSPLTSSHTKFVVTEVRGDWQWHKKVFRFPGVSWNGLSMCYHCRARSKGQWPDLYWNLGETTTWDQHEFTLAEFLEERIPSRGICFLDVF